MANWLNTAFAGFDGAIFRAVNSISNDFLTTLFKIITFLGEKGLVCLVTGVILMLFSKTRKTGFTILFAVGVGALFTNIIIKNAVARPRPYVTNLEFRGYWLATNGEVESEYSFPSGHTTALTAGAIALFCCEDKKWSFCGIILALLVGFTRIYLVVHYPTDVVMGLIVGTVAGVIAFYSVKAIFNLLEKHKDKKFCAFALDFDIIKLIRKEKQAKK